MIHTHPFVWKLASVTIGAMFLGLIIVAADLEKNTAINGAVWVALIVAVSSMTSPLLLAYFTNKQRRKEKLEDWRRQDEVAKQVTEAAEKVAATTAETSKTTIEKLDTIHVLVNSNMTAAMKAELDATVRELAMMREVVDLKKADGKEPTKEAVDAIMATNLRVEELKANLQDRLKT